MHLPNLALAISEHAHERLDRPRALHREALRRRAHHKRGKRLGQFELPRPARTAQRADERSDDRVTPLLGRWLRDGEQRCERIGARGLRPARVSEQPDELWGIALNGTFPGVHTDALVRID